MRSEVDRINSVDSSRPLPSSTAVGMMRVTAFMWRRLVAVVSHSDNPNRAGMRRIRRVKSEAVTTVRNSPRKSRIVNPSESRRPQQLATRQIDGPHFHQDSPRRHASQTSERQPPPVTCGYRNSDGSIMDRQRPRTVSLCHRSVSGSDITTTNQNCIYILPWVIC